MRVAKSKVWKKGMTVIPREVRNILDLTTGDEIVYELEAMKNEVRIIIKKKNA